MSNTSVYDETHWMELECNKLVVAIAGRSSHHPLCLLHFNFLMDSKYADAMPGCLFCHSLQAKCCYIITQSPSMPKAVQSVQTGTYPRSLKIEPINHFIIFMLSTPKLLKSCYFNLWNILTVDQCNHSAGQLNHCLYKTLHKMTGRNGMRLV